MVTEATPNEPQPRRRRRLPRARALLAVFALLAVSTFAFRLWVVETAIVEGGSMETTLRPNDRALVLKLLELRRFDVVVLADPQVHETVIKRIVGLPGDTISMVPQVARQGAADLTTGGGQLYINGKPYDEPYATSRQPTLIAPVKLGQGQYYVLGDSRDVSIDSRTYGPVRRDLIGGVAYVILYPLYRTQVITRAAKMDAEELAQGGSR